MRKNDLDPVILDWLFAREAVRRLGFTPDEIYFAVAKSGIVLSTIDQTLTQHPGPVIALEIQRDGKVFSWTIGCTTLDYDRIEAEFERAAALWNSGELGIGHADFLDSMPGRSAMQLMVALTDRGFTFRVPASA